MFFSGVSGFFFTNVGHCLDCVLGCHTQEGILTESACLCVSKHQRKCERKSAKRPDLPWTDSHQRFCTRQNRSVWLLSSEGFWVQTVSQGWSGSHSRPPRGWCLPLSQQRRIDISLSFCTRRVSLAPVIHIQDSFCALTLSADIHHDREGFECKGSCKACCSLVFHCFKGGLHQCETLVKPLGTWASPRCLKGLTYT